MMEISINPVGTHSPWGIDVSAFLGDINGIPNPFESKSNRKW